MCTADRLMDGLSSEICAGAVTGFTLPTKANLQFPRRKCPLDSDRPPSTRTLEVYPPITAHINPTHTAVDSLSSCFYFPAG